MSPYISSAEATLSCVSTCRAFSYKCAMHPIFSAFFPSPSMLLRWLVPSLSLAWLLGCVSASTRHTFASRAVQDSGLTYTKNSGICETTPGVGQISGYINIASNASMWFWFFEARNSPNTAPLTLWLNGGPGCTSMSGIFQENGPCNVSSDGRTTTLNPFSWNNLSNMIYIDQPIGAGFSTGSGTVNSTADAAVMMWTAFQILFESPEFSSFQNRDLIFGTESYGAHFGPTFITYFNAQNDLIGNGQLTGQKIVFKSLLINDGKHDPLIQYGSYIPFVANAPGYGPVQNTTIVDAMSASFVKPDGCQAQLQACYAGGSDAECATADLVCTGDIFNRAVIGHDPDYLLWDSDAPDPFPPAYFEKFLVSPSVAGALGATSTFNSCNADIKKNFGSTGEFGRSALAPLAALANAHFPILIWVGDADIKANWLGVHQSMVSMPWYGNLTLNNTALTNWTIDGQVVAQIKTVDSFTFARVFGAGHSLPAFVPSTALQFFTRVVQNLGDLPPKHSGSTGVSSPSGLWAVAMLLIWMLDR
ncbi:Alpha/Beta hydrolase protein [Roridomyces roridus]|uniref:Alpha/Beta hydrolase protein n=1 Tax=Roridomyces roridus TaxID=1738132 RepID=A0AAD7C271_9AGAR|nr:Alpha/Beta hydrolase protein [Roridomyces roridus]